MLVLLVRVDKSSPLTTQLLPRGSETQWNMDSLLFKKWAQNGFNGLISGLGFHLIKSKRWHLCGFIVKCERVKHRSAYAKRNRCRDTLRIERKGEYSRQKRNWFTKKLLFRGFEKILRFEIDANWDYVRAIALLPPIHVFSASWITCFAAIWIHTPNLIFLCGEEIFVLNHNLKFWVTKTLWITCWFDPHDVIGYLKNLDGPLCALSFHLVNAYHGTTHSSAFIFCELSWLGFHGPSNEINIIGFRIEFWMNSDQCIGTYLIGICIFCILNNPKKTIEICKDHVETFVTHLFFRLQRIVLPKTWTRFSIKNIVVI